MRGMNIVRVHELTKDTKKLCKKFGAQYCLTIVVMDNNLVWEQWSPDNMQPGEMQYVLAQLGKAVEGLTDPSVPIELRGSGAILEQN